MRWLALTGLLLVSCGLPPQADPPVPAAVIFLDFPELSQWGHVVWIGGREYWQPDPTYFVPAPGTRRFVPAHSIWAPYANGYLYEDRLDGLVWVSHDPWGFITEHYGYWRHHERLGYVWRPLYPLRWTPFAATILYDSDGRILGLCPFYDVAWEAGLYALDFDFDDSYWALHWSTVHERGFYADHEPRFSGYCVSVTFYDDDSHRRAEPEAHFRRDREYRERRHQGDPRGAGLPAERERRREEEPQEPARVGEGLPARPVTTPAAPERSGAESTPSTPGGLPSLPPRGLDPGGNEPAEARPTPERLETRDLRTVETQQPARVAPPSASPEPRPQVPPPAAPAVEPKRDAAPVAPTSGVKLPARATITIPKPPAASTNDSAVAKPPQPPASGQSEKQPAVKDKAPQQPRQAADSSAAKADSAHSAAPTKPDSNSSAAPARVKKNSKAPKN